MSLIEKEGETIKNWALQLLYSVVGLSLLFVDPPDKGGAQMDDHSFCLAQGKFYS